MSYSNNNNLADKICCLLKDQFKDKSRGFSRSVKQLNQEAVFVDTLQRVVDYGNLDILNSFKIRLEIEEYADSDNFARMEGSRD